MKLPLIAINSSLTSQAKACLRATASSSLSLPPIGTRLRRDQETGYNSARLSERAVEKPDQK